MKIKYKYLPADTEITFNQGTWLFSDDSQATLSLKPDPGISPIVKQLPKPPKTELIAGYGLAPEDQYWENLRPKIPSRLEDLMNDNDYPTRNDKIKLLDDNPDYYEEEIKFIINEQKYVREGFWLYIKGKPFLLTKDNFVYLQYWQIDGDNPYFVMRDYTWFWAVEFFGYIEPLCFGVNVPKERRIGDTNKTQCAGLRQATTTPFFKGSMQSKDADHASEIFQLLTLINWENYPFYLQPIWNEDHNNKSSIKFYSPKFKSSPNYRKKSLNSLLDFTNSGELALDGKKRNFIHNDECGKTVEANVYDRWKVQKPCMVQGAEKIGFAINTSTVELMETKGGKNFKKLCDESHYNPPIKQSLDYKPRNKNGQTASGLVNIFIPSNEGFYIVDKTTGRHSIDKYGYPDLVWTTKYLLNERESEKKGKTEDYIAYLRKYPLIWDECWLYAVKDCRFNLSVLNKREDELQYLNPKPYKKGNFKWKDGIKDSTVEWIDDEESGRWIVSYLFKSPVTQANKVVIQYNKKYPDNWLNFVAGGDPYKYKESGSKGGGCVIRKRDYSLDTQTTDVSKWRTHQPVATYSYRHRHPDIYGEDMIMMCHYYGCKMSPETNVTFLREHFERRGYENFLYYFRDQDGMEKSEPGGETQTKSKEWMFALIDSFIDLHGERLNHPEIIEQCKLIQDDFGPFDMLVAFAYALKAAREDDHFTPYNQVPTEVSKDIEEFYKAVPIEEQYIILNN